MLFVVSSVALVWNFTVCLLAVLLIKFEGDIAATWFLALLYMVIGIPGAWFTWCGPLPTLSPNLKFETSQNVPFLGHFHVPNLSLLAPATTSSTYH